MGSHGYSNHTSWKQNSEIILEVPEGAKASDFMFQLDEKINLKKLGELVETSKQKLTAEKSIDNPHLEMAFIKFMPQSEIAERLGLPIGTVKSRTRLAYKKLKENLEELR